MESMQQANEIRNRQQVAWWLLIGVGMIVIQVILGGITRLTESGLSITEWKPITGALPPLNDAAWQAEFDKYRHTDQFKYVHQHFSLQDFKFIFFWEWFHRLWARLIGVVFIIGFVYFLWKRKFDRSMIRPLLVLFVLGALQGAIGWIMVKSGLVPEMYFVGHVELTTHFIAALLLLAATLWYALSMLPSFDVKLESASIRNRLYWIAAVLFLQLMYGGFMAGMKAGAVAPTWPTINGHWLPAAQLHELGSLTKDLFQNKIMVQFVHRGLAYILCLLIAWFYFRTANRPHSRFNRWRTILFFLIVVQLILGILTVLNATDSSRLVWLGVMHQFTAMWLVMAVTVLLFLVRAPKAGAVSAH